MRHRSLLRRAVVAALVVASVALFALGAVTSYRYIEWSNPNVTRDDDILIWKGMIDVKWGARAPLGFILWSPPPGVSMGPWRPNELEPMPPWRWRPWFDSGRGWSFGTLGLPIWLLLATTLTPLAVLHWRARRNAKRRDRCPDCGYDRKGLPAAAPCPECGPARPTPPSRLRRTFNRLLVWKWLWTVTFLVIATLWCVSGWFLVGWQRHDGYFAALTDGRVCVGWANPRDPHKLFGYYSYDKKWWSVSLCFEYRPSPMVRPGTGYCDLLVPLWAAAMPAGALAIGAWRSNITQRRRATEGRCLSCGYDRRDLPSDAKCPECGVAPTPNRPEPAATAPSVARP